ncbi:MAG TPA: hypothetical protein VL326_06390 [Kofleriaceae bacterium]|jgi:hypothetical protein|nr:hypothetical protein [Kofleriaceae bacterium]
MTRLPAAPTPPLVVPPQVQASAPPAAGTGRLVVDVVDGPTQVQRVRLDPQPVTTAKGRTAYRFNENSDALCPASPCISDLSPQNVLLAFPVIGDPDSFETEMVNVDAQTNIYRRSLSEYHHRSPGVYGILMTTLGGTAMMTGATLLPIGLAKDIGGMTTAGAISLGAGTVALVLGIIALRHNASTYRPGSMVHFTLAPAGPAGTP